MQVSFSSGALLSGMTPDEDLLFSSLSGVSATPFVSSWIFSSLGVLLVPVPGQNQFLKRTLRFRGILESHASGCTSDRGTMMVDRHESLESSRDIDHDSSSALRPPNQPIKKPNRWAQSNSIH